MKKSITVLSIEAAGVRGVRLEETGADWNCVDREFWPIGGGRRVDEPYPGVSSPDNNSPKDGDGGAANPQTAEDEAVISVEERYAATVNVLKAAAKRFGANEVVLSMPLSELLVKIVRTPAENRDALAETALAELGKVSPFPDETPVIGMESVSETDSALTTVLAALPESRAVDIGDALDEAGIRVLRTDITALGWLRTLWPRIFVSGNVADDGGISSRTVVLMDLDNGWDIIVLDDCAPTLMRGLGCVSDPGELSREITLSLLQEDMPAALSEIVVFSKREVSDALVQGLKAFAPVRIEKVDIADADCGVDGVARRTQEGATLDVTPADWVELRTETTFKRKLKTFLIASTVGWALVMGALFAVPMVYAHLTERQKAQSKRHARQYREVKEMCDKAELVQQYSDHAHSSLEMLKAVSDRMPEGVTLTSFNYRRGDKLTIAGEAQRPTDVYDFKNAIASAKSVSDDDGEARNFFENVNLVGPSLSRGVHKFTIEIDFRAKEDDE